MVGQDNITYDRTCPGRMKEEKGYAYIHTHTHDTNCLILLLCDI